MAQIRFPALKLKLSRLWTFRKSVKATSEIAATDKGAFLVAFAFDGPLCSCWDISFEMMDTKSTTKNENNETMPQDNWGTSCEDDAAEIKTIYTSITLGQTYLFPFG